MKIILKLIILQWILITVANAHICENESFVKTVLEQVQMEPTSGDLVDCKVDPDNPSEMIMAYAVWKPDDEDSGIGSYLLKILKFKQDGSKVNIIFADKDELSSDAVALESIHLDTANYRITTENRALGVRFHYIGQSRVNPWSFNLLSLYNLKSKKKILDRFMVSEFQAETDASCNADVKERESTLTMQNTESKQVFDILVKSKIKSYQSRRTIDDCVDSKYQFSGQRFILKYDGSQYQIPKAYRSEYSY